MDEVNMDKLKITSQSKSDKSSGATATEKQVNDGVSNNGAVHSAPQVSPNLPVCIELQRVSANWVNGQLPPTLCNISTTIKSGELCALVGAVGSGKSSILHLILQELNPGAGNVIFTQGLSQENFQGKYKSHNGYLMDNPNLLISYASQEAWLFGGTVRDNILFGQPYDRTRYTQVLARI